MSRAERIPPSGRSERSALLRTAGDKRGKRVPTNIEVEVAEALVTFSLEINKRIRVETPRGPAVRSGRDWTRS